MANYNKFNIDNYVHIGYSTYLEYKEIAEELGVSVHKLIVDDSYKYLDLIESGYTFVVEDIQKILDISNRNTIQTKITKNINKMYINKPVKDLLYLACGKYNKNQIPQIEIQVGLSESCLYLFYEKLLDRCKELNIKPDFLVKKTFMKQDDIATSICNIFKKEEIREGKKFYVDISKKEIELIMTNGLKSDKTLRYEYGFSNLNQIQRRIEKGKLKGYVGRFVLVGESSKLPLVRYLICENE